MALCQHLIAIIDQNGLTEIEFTTFASAEDILMLDKLINERASDGWELVTYDYMATSTQIKGAFVVTFRKEKA